MPPDELATIPEHWLTYPEPNVSLHYLLGTLYIAFMFVALIGNGLVLWIFTTYVNDLIDLDPSNESSINHYYTQ